jgi:SPX domain protein involved in polyphosphate accumulation
LNLACNRKPIVVGTDTTNGTFIKDNRTFTLEGNSKAMVDFGLKLKDNKVAEWKEKYINYDILDELLKRAESSVKIFEVLSRRDPTLAVDVKAHFIASRQSDRNKRSTENLLRSIRRSLSYASYERLDFEERDALLSSRRSLTPTHTTSRTHSSQNNESPFIGKLLSRNMSGCFELTMEDKLQETLRVQYDILNDFSKRIVKEMNKCNDFYQEKILEMEHMLSMLEDHVKSSQHLKALLIHPTDKNRPHKARSKNNLLSALHRAENNSDVGHGENDLLLREIESVKRAVIDIHRRTKLLENFAIMNTTAFVHIIKQFDSVFSEHKGRFSSMGNDDNICGGGLEASSLCEKMVRTWQAKT